MPVNNTYGSSYHTYPVFSEELGFEGAVKRFTPLPFPEDVYNYALMGLPKKFPLTGEPITVDMAAPSLESALVELEMDLGMDITETQHFQSFDYVADSFSVNYSGYILERWPVTKVMNFQLKFPHTQQAPAYQSYTIPSQWIALRRSRVNVVASYGAVGVTTQMDNFVTAGGLFSFLSGFSSGPWRPAMIEVTYMSGFPEDRVPTMVSDLVKSFAAMRFLQDIIPVLFPVAGTSVGLDGVSQSAQIPLLQAFTARIQMLQQKCHDQKAAIKKVLGKSLKMSFIGT